MAGSPRPHRPLFQLFRQRPCHGGMPKPHPLFPLQRRGPYARALQNLPSPTLPSSRRSPPPGDLREGLLSRPRVASLSPSQATSGNSGRSPSPQRCWVEPEAPKCLPASSLSLANAGRSSPRGRKVFLPPIYGDTDNEFPSGNPLHWPNFETCIVPVSPAM